MSHAQPGLILPSSVLRMAFGGSGTPPSGLVRKKHAAWPISQKGCPCLYVDATSIAPRQVQCSKPAQEDWEIKIFESRCTVWFGNSSRN